MATKIIHKKSSTASSIPSAGALEPGELALNLADKKIYSKTTGGAIIEFNDAPVAIQTKTEFTATAGQTTFAVSYTAGAVNVYRNGVYLGKSDYVATDGGNIILGTGCTVGDSIEIEAFTVSAVTAQAAVMSDIEFTATAGQTVFTTNYDVGGIMVFLNGIKLQDADYAASNGTTVVLASGASLNDLIEINKFVVTSVHTQNAHITTFTQTATAGTTTFNVNYTAGQIQVFLNGLKLTAADFTASNGTTIVLAVAAQAGDIFEAEVYAIREVLTEKAIKSSEEFTATANQTTFNFSYTVGSIDVFLNGIKLPDSDFTASNGSTVVLDTGAQVGAAIELVKYTVGELAAAAAVITNTAFTATAGQTSFTVTYTPNQVEVFLNGLKLPDADYTASSGSAIVLAVGAQVGDSLEVQKYSISDINAVKISLDGSPTLSANLDTATFTVDGRDVSTDGTKLDGIAASANNYVHPTTSGNNHIPTSGSSGQILAYASDGVAAWSSPAAGVPTGMIVPHAIATEPTGFIECDGAAVSRTTYSDLFAVIATNYGVGDGSSTFNIPDLRGEFIRGFANGSANDPDRAARLNRGDGTTGDVVGSKQDDIFKSHNHTAPIYLYDSGGGHNKFRSSRTLNFQTNASTNSTGGNETRPTNVQMMYCIKT